MELTLTDTVGYIASVVGTMLMLPQVWKAWKTKRVEDLSFGMVILYFFNCLLWLLYGLLLEARPLILANGIALIISIVQIILKLKYRVSLAH